MTPSEIKFLMATLETKNNEFKYYKDKYALDLLRYFVSSEMSVAALKQSELGFLTNKPIVKERLSRIGGKWVNDSTFQMKNEDDAIKLNYSLSKWGAYFGDNRKDDWYQTSRSGINLVLQLNFDSTHNEAYYEFLEPESHPFYIDNHPVKKPTKQGGITMGWARLDVDLDNGEVLIEEIQNDWLREATVTADWAKRRIALKKASEKTRPKALEKIEPETFMTYYQKYLKKYIGFWDEALLNLAINFGKEQLGCNTVYYNTFETGNHFKGLPEGYPRPPKSLYTKLPRKFGFKITDQPPYMLLKDIPTRKKFRKKGLRWFVMELSS